MGDFNIAVHHGETHIAVQGGRSFGGGSTLSNFSMTMPELTRPTPTVQKVINRRTRVGPASKSRIQRLAEPTNQRIRRRSKSVNSGKTPTISSALAASQRRLDPLAARPGTSETIHTEAMSGMVESVTSCIRAVERNVLELDKFVMATGVIADTPLPQSATPPIQVVKMRLQVTIDGLQAVRTTLEGMGQHFSGAVDEALRAAMGDLSSIIPSTPSSAMGRVRTPMERLIESRGQSILGSAASANRLESRGDLFSRASMVSLKSLGSTPPNTAPLAFKSAPVAAPDLFDHMTRQFGSTSEQSAAAKLGMKLREWLVEGSGSGERSAAAGGSIDSHTAQCHLKLLSEVAGHVGAFKGLLDNSITALTQALFQDQTKLLYVPEQLAHAEEDRDEAIRKSKELEEAFDVLRERWDRENDEACQMVADHRNRKRRKARMSRKDAEKISGQHKLYEAVVHIVTSVDLFTMLVTKLRTSRPMEASIQDLAELTAQYVEELGLESVKQFRGYDDVLEDILTVFLAAVEKVTGGIVHSDPNQLNMWVLDNSNVPLQSSSFDDLSQVLVQCEKSARERQRRADRVIATWNRCGLNDADVMTSEDEEIVTDADATAAANSQQFQLQIKDHETTIIALKEKIESLGISMQQGRDRETQLKGIAANEQDDKETLKEFVLATLSDKLDCGKKELSRCLTLKLGVEQLSQVATETKNKLAVKQAAMKDSTPRPRYDTTPAIREAMVQIEMANIEPPDKHASTDTFVSSVLEVLGQTLEEKQYYCALAESTSDKGEKVNSAPKYITAYGCGAAVPVYLQWSGRLPLRPIGKRETQLLIRQVWSEKQSLEDIGDQHIQMDQFLHQFLQARVGNPELVASWAYNIVFSLERHRFEGDQVQLFLMVLRGQISEEVKAGQQDEVEAVQALLNYKFEAACVASGNDEVPVGALMEVLAGHWGEAKSKQDLIELQAAAVADAHTGNGPQMIKRPAETLFPVRDNNEVDTQFVVCMRDQYVHSVLQYTLDIEAAISAASAMGIVNHSRGPEQCVGGYDAFRAIKVIYQVVRGLF